MLSALLLTKTEITILIIVAVVVVLCVIGISCIVAFICIVWWLNTVKTYRHLKGRVDEGWETLEKKQKKRFALVYEYTDKVKRLTETPPEALEKVVSARQLAMKAVTQEEKMAENAKLTLALRECFADIVKTHPEWSANQTYVSVYEPLAEFEKEIEISRQYYNGVVRTFNTKLDAFPARIVANRMDEAYQKELYFYLNEAERKKHAPFRK